MGLKPTAPTPPPMMSYTQRWLTRYEIRSAGACLDINSTLTYLRALVQGAFHLALVVTN